MMMLGTRSSTSLKVSTTLDAGTRRSTIVHPFNSRNVRRSSPDLTLTCPRNRGKPKTGVSPTNNQHNQQPTTNNQQLTTNNQQPTTNNQQLTTNNQQPTTNNQQQTTNN